jgi:hypothetical protein
MWPIHVNIMDLRAIRERMAHPWFFKEPGVWRELAIPRQMATEKVLKIARKAHRRAFSTIGGL